MNLIAKFKFKFYYFYSNQIKNQSTNFKKGSKQKGCNQEGQKLKKND